MKFFRTVCWAVACSFIVGCGAASQVGPKSYDAASVSVSNEDDFVINTNTKNLTLGEIYEFAKCNAAKYTLDSGRDSFGSRDKEIEVRQSATTSGGIRTYAQKLSSNWFFLSEEDAAKSSRSAVDILSKCAEKSIPIKLGGQA